MQRGHEKCTVHFNIYSNKSFNNKIRASSAGPQREIMTLLQWLHPLSRDARIPIFAHRTKHRPLRSPLCSFTYLRRGSNNRYPAVLLLGFPIITKNVLSVQREIRLQIWPAVLQRGRLFKDLAAAGEAVSFTLCSLLNAGTWTKLNERHFQHTIDSRLTQHSIELLRKYK